MEQNNQKPFSKQFEVEKKDVSKAISDMKSQGYKFISTLGSRTVPVTEPDMHGVSYGGETYVELLFELEKTQ